MTEPTPERRDLLAALTREAVDAGSYGEPAPETTEPTLRDQLADVLREKFDWWIVAEWICCDPPVKGHKLCKQGHAARGVVASLLADDPEEHPPTSPILDALMPVVESALARARASCCEDGDRTYGEMERHLTERAEQAERRHADSVNTAAWHLNRATQRALEMEQRALAAERERDDARAAVERVRELAANAEMTANIIDPDGDVIQFPAVAVRDLRATLDEPGDVTVAIRPDDSGYRAAVGELHATLDRAKGIPAVTEETAVPVDWEVIARQRERELKKVGEARHQAESAVARVQALVDKARSNPVGRFAVDYTGAPFTPSLDVEAVQAALTPPEEKP